MNALQDAAQDLSADIVKLSIQEEAKRFPKSFRGIASVLDTSTGMISESTLAEGERMITFNGILKYDTLILTKDSLAKIEEVYA